jgi:hypothetical protein
MLSPLLPEKEHNLARLVHSFTVHVPRVVRGTVCQRDATALTLVRL